MQIKEQTRVVDVKIELTVTEANQLCAALYRMQSYHLGEHGSGIPASRRSEYRDLEPLFTLYDLLYSRGYEL